MYYHGPFNNSLAQYSSYWKSCIQNKVGTLTLGKTSQSAFEAAVASCNGLYPDTYDSFDNITHREFRFCNCASTTFTSVQALLCSGKQWAQGAAEPACPVPWTPGMDGNPYNIRDVNAGCRPCTTSLTLTGGGTVEATKTLTGQSVRVTGCYGNPVQGVVVQITVAPLNPASGPAGKLRPEGSDPSVTGSTVYSGVTNANGEARFEFVAPGSAGTQTLTAQCIGQTCTPSTAGPATITVTECRTLSMEGGGNVEPWFDLPATRPGTTDPVQFVSVENCAGTAASSVPVAITLSVDPTSGFHPHGESVAVRPVGVLAPSTGGCTVSATTWTCSTDSQGLIPFSFRAPGVAGKHTVEAHCVNASDHCTGSGSLDVIVKFDGIESRTASTTAASITT